MPDLTDQQQKVLKYMRDYYHAPRRVLPSYREVAKHFGWDSHASSRWHINSLIKQGHLKKDKKGKLTLS